MLKSAWSRLRQWWRWTILGERPRWPDHGMAIPPTPAQLREWNSVKPRRQGSTYYWPETHRQTRPYRVLHRPLAGNKAQDNQPSKPGR